MSVQYLIGRASAASMPPDPNGLETTIRAAPLPADKVTDVSTQTFGGARSSPLSSSSTSTDRLSADAASPPVDSNSTDASSPRFDEAVGSDKLPAGKTAQPVSTSARDTNSGTNGSIVSPVPDPNSAAGGQERESELVGFVVRGRRQYERLQIDDLDSLVAADGKRLLPLLRILNAFRVRIEEQVGIFRFALEGIGDVELDLGKGQIRVKDQTRPIELLQAVSDITQKPDIYVSAEDLSKILDMELVWNTELYEYRIQLDRDLSIWKLIAGTSLLSKRTAFVGADLPEVLPPADRSREPLQFLEFDWRPSYSWRRAASKESGEQSDSHSLNVSGPRETLWGNVRDGQYKVSISHPSLAWSSQNGWNWERNEAYVAQADWFEWVRRFPTSEVTVGDSVFGLSNMVYPVFSATGVRVNGLAGWTRGEVDSDRSQLGLRRYFGGPQIFQGPAPIGATAELIVNGRTVEVQSVAPQADSPPGMGVYRFEAIELPNGILNEITIVIKETNGNEIRVEKSIMGAPQLVPKGRAAYLGVLGSKRERDMPDKEILDAGDFYGYIAGGRLLYGLTDRLTVGTVFASQEDHYHRYLRDDVTRPGTRSYPKSSEHAGVTFSSMPLGNLMLSGDVAGSQAQGTDAYGDIATRMRTEYLPTQKMTLDADFLNLGSDYFDGVDPEVADRRGGEMGLSWKLHRKWTLDGGIGQVRDNLDGRLEETTAVDYYNIGLQTTVLPRTSLSARLHNLAVSTEEDSRLLTELGLRMMPARDLSIYGRIYLGDDLAIPNNSRFLSPLRLHHAPRFLGPSQYWAIRKSLNQSNAITLMYSDSQAQQTLSVAHDYRVDIRSHPLRLRTEVIRDLKGDRAGDYDVRGTGEYLFDRLGYNRLGLTAEYRDGNYGFFLYLSMRTLFSHHDGRLININESYAQPAYGAIHGKVFLDYNGNHLQDADEPGVPDIKVGVANARTTVTDKRGYYILQAPSRVSEVRVYLDIDTVPATYSVTHGTQLAKVCKESLTEVNLSLAPLISVVGHVVTGKAGPSEPNTADPNASDIVSPAVFDGSDPSRATKPLSGVRVSLSNPQSGLLVAGSVTGNDGSYYLGDVKPGQYVLRVDAKTLPKQYQIAEQERTIEVKPTKEEFLEITLPDFVATVRSEAKKPGDATLKGKGEKDLKADPNQAPR